MSNAFKYTFPIAKAEKREDGYYIVGYASGPEVDTEGERMAPEAITRFSEQINSADEDARLVYRDAHAPDGVMRDLGEITKAWVTEKFHLGIEVKLDEDNPASMLLYKKLKKGKQYGMSVAGHVVDYAMEFVTEIGKSVLTYKNVVLDEISNTTRPAWYPSFGTVLSKSLKDASSDASAGENVVKVGPNGELLDETVEDATKSDDAADAVVEDTTEKADEAVADETAVEKASDAAQDASSAAYIEASLIALLGGEAGEEEDMAPLRAALASVQQFIAQETAEIGTPEDSTESSMYAGWSASDKELADEVAKAGRKLSGATSAELRSLYETMTETLTTLGVIDAEAVEVEDSSEKSASAAEEDTVEKTEDVEATAETITKSDLDALAAALAKANERIAELEARPATQVPGLITDETRKAAEDELAEILSKASPSEKMRLAFAARTGGK